MKKNKGFTLIELLAVITIMGILMIVAIGSVNRIIENARRDTFATTAKEYLKTVRQEVMADNISCDGVTASGTPDGTYYFTIDTKDQNTKDLMESGGKSPFGGAELQGYVKWVKETKVINEGLDNESTQTKITYSIALTDTGKHGLVKELQESDIKRVNVSTDTSTCDKKVCENGLAKPAPDVDAGVTLVQCTLN